MPHRLVALPLLVALAGCEVLYPSAIETTDGDDVGGGGGYEVSNGGAGEGGDRNGNAPNADPAGALGPQDDPEAPPPEACSASGFSVGPTQGHLAGAMFALAALKDGGWPNDVDRTLFVLPDFLSYFAIQESGPGDSRTHGRLVSGASSTDGSPESVLQIFITPPSLELAGPPPAMDLVVVVDTSSSMRNDFGIASSVIHQLASQVQAEGFHIVEWGAKSELFEDEALDPVERAEAFAERLDTLQTAQLGPGGSLAPVADVVSSVIQGRANAHVVVVTDGGLVADSESFATVNTWAAQNAPVSFIEVQGVEGQKTYHASKLRNLAASGNGIVMYAAPSTVSLVGNHFDRLRPLHRGLELSMTTATLSPAQFVDAAGTDPTSSGEYLAWNRPLFISLPVRHCNAIEGVTHVIEIEADGEFLTESTTLAIDSNGDLYLDKVALVERVHRLLVAGCEDDGLIGEISALFTELDLFPSGAQSGFDELRQVLTRMDDLARSECAIASP